MNVPTMPIPKNRWNIFGKRDRGIEKWSKKRFPMINFNFIRVRYRRSLEAVKIARPENIPSIIGIGVIRNFHLQCRLFRRYSAIDQDGMSGGDKKAVGGAFGQNRDNGLFHVKYAEGFGMAAVFDVDDFDDFVVKKIKPLPVVRKAGAGPGEGGDIGIEQRGSTGVAAVDVEVAAMVGVEYAGCDFQGGTVRPIEDSSDDFATAIGADVHNQQLFVGGEVDAFAVGPD